MSSTDWLVIAGVAALGAQALIDRRAFMGQLEDLQAAVAAARVEIEADKAAIIAEIQRLGLPDQDISPVLASVSELGSVLDDVPGVTPPPPPPPVEEPPVEELPAEGE